MLDPKVKIVEQHAKLNIPVATAGLQEIISCVETEFPEEPPLAVMRLYQHAVTARAYVELVGRCTAELEMYS